MLLSLLLLMLYLLKLTRSFESTVLALILRFLDILPSLKHLFVCKGLFKHDCVSYELSASARNFLSVIVLFFVPVNFAFAIERVALIIGNDNYEQAPLNNSVNDATAIADVFTKMGYTTLLSTNADRMEMESVIDSYSELAASAEYAVFFYAGHALQVNGANYLIPIKSRLESFRDLKKLIPLSDVIDEVQNAHEFGLILLDACRINPFSKDGRLGRAVFGEGLAVDTGGDNVLIAYATEQGAIAADGTGNHSPYTAALLKHISAPNRDARMVLGEVRDSVVASTDGLQRPFFYGSLGGSRYILNPESPATASPEAFSISAVSDSTPEAVEDDEFRVRQHRMDELRQAISNKNLERIKSLATESKTWSRYLSYLFANFETIDVSLSDVRFADDNSAVQGQLKIERMVKANGDIGMPSDEMNSILVTSKLSAPQSSLLDW